MAKHPFGRPPKYKKEYCKMLINHMAKGYSYESFAGDLEVSRDTLYKWEEKYPDFLYSKKIAFDKCLKWFEKIAHLSMAGELKNTNSAMWIFSMKNKFRWTDRTEVETKSMDNDIAKMTLEEVEAEILKRRNAKP